MEDRHIIDVLDGSRLADMTAGELERVEAHAGSCVTCRRAYDAARIAVRLARVRASAASEPPPYFHTRVMAAIRERRAVEDDMGIERLWRAAWSYVAAMALVVAGLAAATLTTSSGPAEPEVAAAQAIYSPEWEALADAGGELSDEQILATLYEAGR